MREIKFRAWNGSNWLYFTLEQLVAGSATNFEEYNLRNWTQFTGLQDKNGKDIYEGDILQNNLEESIVLVIWEETGARWSFDEHCTFDDGVGRGNWDLNMGYAKNSEVIGNIYENPELLTRS